MNHYEANSYHVNDILKLLFLFPEGQAYKHTHEQLLQGNKRKN